MAFKGVIPTQPLSPEQYGVSNSENGSAGLIKLHWDPLSAKNLDIKRVV